MRISFHSCQDYELMSLTPHHIHVQAFAFLRNSTGNPPRISAAVKRERGDWSPEQGVDSQITTGHDQVAGATFTVEVSFQSQCPECQLDTNAVL